MISVYNESELKENYRRYKKYIDDYIDQERRDKLISLLEKYEPRILNSPASLKIDRYNAFPGGYIDHLNHVIDLCISNFAKFENILEEKQFREKKESLIFSAAVHDLAKLGTITKPHFKKEWKISRIKYGNIYVYNKELQYATYHDRTFQLLANADISISEEEFFTIRMAKGPFTDESQNYWTYYDDTSLLPVILYTSVFQAQKIETRKYKELLEAKLDMFLRDKTGGNVSLFDEGKNDPERSAESDENVAAAVQNFFNNMDEEE